MESVLYFVARAMLALIQLLPLRVVARLGRFGGAIVWALDARHRGVALANLKLAFPDKTPAEIRAICIENFRRTGENFASAARTSAMSIEELRKHVVFVAPHLTNSPADTQGRTVVAIGHFGNFELYARFGQFAPGYSCGTTYRGLRQNSLNGLLQRLRGTSGCEFFERRRDVRALKQFMSNPVLLLGLLADQHGGDGGLELPFFGHNCSTTPAPAVFAHRYGCRLLTAFCFRDGLAHWRLETGREIPVFDGQRPRTAEEIMVDINKDFEAAVRRDPANWFWVHNRWKLKWKREGHPQGRPNRRPRPKPAVASSHA